MTMQPEATSMRWVWRPLGLAGCADPTWRAGAGGSDLNLTRDDYQCRLESTQVRVEMFGIAGARSAMTRRKDLYARCVAARGWEREP
jgi:hypothetical protein